MTTEIESPDMGCWYENLTNRSTREKGIADWYSKEEQIKLSNSWNRS